MDVTEVKWSQGESPILSEEEELVIKKRMAAMDKLLAEEGKAKYRLEVMLGVQRHVRGVSPGMISFWESGTKFHGGGDVKIYMCPGKEKGVSNCVAMIPDVQSGFGHLLCPTCKTVWKGEEVIGEVFFRLPTQKWAEVLVTYYRRLDHNADIYLKYQEQDLRKATELEQQKELRGDKLSIARDKRGSVLYPLKNIIKDTQNGASLYDRFYAFLVA